MNGTHPDVVIVDDIVPVDADARVDDEGAIVLTWPTVPGARGYQVRSAPLLLHDDGPSSARAEFREGPFPTPYDELASRWPTIERGESARWAELGEKFAQGLAAGVAEAARGLAPVFEAAAAGIAEVVRHAELDRLAAQASKHSPRTPRDELREILAASEPWGGATRYIRGELAVPPPERDFAVAKVEALAYPLYAHDAARALGIEGLVGVHIGWRWANVAARWEVARLDRDGELVGEWVPVEARPELLDRGRYCPDHGVDLVPPDRTWRTRRYCPECPPGSALGFPSPPA